MPFRSEAQKKLIYAAAGKAKGIGGLTSKDAQKFIKHSKNKKKKKKKTMFSKGKES